jgi:DNA-directed RNA polymerase sigma subunit (sigma70/sigma32)
MNPFWLAFASLTSKERRAIALRVRQGKSIEEVARALGTTLERAQAIEAHALEKLRQRFDTGGTSLRELLPG